MTGHGSSSAKALVFPWAAFPFRSSMDGTSESGPHVLEHAPSRSNPLWRKDMAHDRITRTASPTVPGISDSTRVTSGDLVFISGQVGFEADGSVPDSFERAIRSEEHTSELQSLMRTSYAVCC